MVLVDEFQEKFVELGSRACLIEMSWCYLPMSCFDTCL